MLVTVATADIVEYRGSKTPSYARLFANRQFTDSTGVVVAAGSERKPEFGQRLALSVVSSTTIRLAESTIYSTVDSNDPSVTYRLVIYDSGNKPIMTLFENLRVPAITPTTWEVLRLFSAGRVLRDAPSYLSAQETITLIQTMIDA